MAEEVLRVEHLAKRFGPVVALRDINLHLRKGEVLGLLGDNGAGKSTLMKIICGFEKPDTGQMFLRGEPYEPKSVDHARSLGIDTVYQDLALIDELSVFQNMFLRRERVHRPLPFMANRSMRRETRAALDEIGIDIRNLNQPVARVDDDRACRQRPEVDADDVAHYAAFPCPLAAIRARRYSLTTSSVSSSTDVSVVDLSSAITPSWIRFTRSQLASTCT